MRILVHDYAGHPFQIQLSRALAARGHTVTHAYCAKLVTPRGSLTPRSTDPPRLAIEPVLTHGTVDKQTLVRRRAQEFVYAFRLRSLVDRVDPEVVLSGNAPLDAQRLVLRWCRSRGRRFVFWLQDLIGVGARRVLKRRFGPLGDLVGARLERSEARLLRASDSVVAITEDFLPWLHGRNISSARCAVVPNWAPLEELPVRPKVNPWSLRHGLAASRVLLYSGTLGMKHDPSLLLRLAARLAAVEDVQVVVVSEGSGADWLRREAAHGGPPNLTLLPFQPFEELPDVLGSADVLLGLLEPDAGVFSVPSKVLTSLCAGRALLLAVPRANLAARIVVEAEAGFVVDPREPEAFVEHAERLLADPALRERLGARARAHAAGQFDIGRIASRFEAVLDAAPALRPLASEAG
jgi:glycosyltransferase involved in cell wall biosynthesis